jgi:hypothetical protein
VAYDFAFPGELIEAVVALENHKLLSLVSAADMQEHGGLDAERVGRGVVEHICDESDSAVGGVLDEEESLPVSVFEEARDTFAFDFGDDFAACFSRTGVSGGGYEACANEADHKQAQKGYFIGLIFSCFVYVVHIGDDDNCWKRVLQPWFDFEGYVANAAIRVEGILAFLSAAIAGGFALKPVLRGTEVLLYI